MMWGLSRIYKFPEFTPLRSVFLSQLAIIIDAKPPPVANI
jgi:hypothetical protein